VSRNGHREKKARVESLTVGQLSAFRRLASLAFREIGALTPRGCSSPEDNAETQAFANVLAQGFVPTAKAGEYAFLETPHTFSDNEDADADIDEAEVDDGAQDVFGRVDAPELRVRSHREARLLAVQQSRARRAFEERGVDEDDDVEMLSREARGDDDDEMLDERVLRDLSPQVNLGLSSSPAAPLKLNLKHRAVAATASVAQAAHVEDYTQIDVRLSLSLSQRHLRLD